MCLRDRRQVEAGDLPDYLRAERRQEPQAAAGDDPDFWQAARGREEAFRFLISTMGRIGHGVGRGTLRCV